MPDNMFDALKRRRMNARALDVPGLPGAEPINSEKPLPVRGDGQDNEKLGLAPPGAEPEKDSKEQQEGMQLMSDQIGSGGGGLRARASQHWSGK